MMAMRAVDVHVADECSVPVKGHNAVIMESVLPSRTNIVRYGAIVSIAGLTALAFWPAFFGTGNFLPHTFCYLSKPSLVWTHAVTDLLIGLSYVAISAMLTLLVHRARRDIPFSWVFLAFGLFIVACGTTHFMEVLVLWKAWYWLSASVKIVTAIASVATAIVLPPLIPKAVAMVQEAKKSEARRMELQEQVAALERERAARAEAEEASRARDAFLATLSHELRTPMTTILGWASMIRGGTLDAEATSTGMAAIEQSARAQAQLIDDLLDVSRIVAGKLALELRRTDLGDVIRAALEAVALGAEKKGIHLEVMLPPSPVALTADAARLHQVVTNILTNAVKFTPAGGRVQVELRREHGQAVVVVTDTGIGIESDFLPYVFDRFTQADASFTRGYSGLGLGLAIARHLVELHGGTIAAESGGKGKGSTFTVRLPLHTGIAVPEHAPVRPSGAHVDLGGVRLLLVEDEPLTRDMLRVALADCGAAVRTAGSVDEALRAFDEEPPHAVVTDIAMPDQDGFTLLQQLRTRGARIPVIAVSALVRADEKTRIMMAGFDDYLQKPVHPARLAAAVARKVRPE